MAFPLSWVVLEPMNSLEKGRAGSGEDDHLRAEDETGAEADLQRQPSAELGMLLEQAMSGEWDRGR
ncbi:hypothetical protein ABE10_01920 [Bacillus toyonensis]|nr:hypothetical protein [Bacillus toyonensis]